MVVSKVTTVADYLSELPPERAKVIAHVRDLVNQALPDGYREGIGYGMIGWVVPLEDYPDTYNGQPLIYAGLAAQKNHFALYLNCVYSSPERTERLKSAFAEAGKKLDMGKSCIRFKRVGDLPEMVVAAEIASATPEQFIAINEAARQRGGG